MITVALIVGIAGCDGSCSCSPIPLQYYLTILGAEGGQVIIPGEGIYDEGTVVTLTAVAYECYEFVNWTGANVTDPNSATTTITMDAAKNVTANFARLSYELTVDSTDGGEVTTPSEGTFTYDCGTVVDLVAEAEAGYYFVNWTGATVADPNSATTTITMDAAKNVTANFEQVPPGQFVLTTSSTAGGSVTTPGEGIFPYDEGIVVDLVAVADECYEFVNWTGANVADPNSATTTITMDGAKNVTANFALLSYDLTVDSTDGGEVTTPSEGTFTYDCGTVVDLVAEAEVGYGFVEWTGDVGTTADIDVAVTTITVNGNYSITAKFAWQYYLSIHSTTGGSVTEPGEGLFACDEGSVVDLVAEPEEGYIFVNWIGNVGTIANVYAASTTITMNDHHCITAIFATGIWDWYDLDDIRNHLYRSYFLMNNLDSNSAGYTELASATANEGRGWEPIGNNTAFTGSFNGQGYEISDLFIDRPAESGVGLFGVVGKRGVIKNVGVVNGNVTGDNDVGGLVGKNSGTASNSYSTVSITGNLNVGGLVGYNFFGIVTNSYATGSVIGQNNVGGLVGWNRGAVSKSYATGSVIGQNNVGGLVGKNSGAASNSYSTGSVTGDDNVGGLVGRNDWSGVASNSYSTGSVTGNTHVGGLVGRNAGSVRKSFWDTQTSGQATSDGGMGKTTAAMMDIATFTGAWWDITTVDPGETNLAYIWNIVDTVTYPFLSWQPVV